MSFSKVASVYNTAILFYTKTHIISIKKSCSIIKRECGFRILAVAYYDLQNIQGYERLHLFVINLLSFYSQPELPSTVTVVENSGF